MVLDGNRRKARRNQQPVVEGHRSGGNTFKATIERSRAMQNIRVLAAWCMSRKNFESRSPEEIDGIFSIGTEFLTDLRDNWMDLPENQQVRLLHMGERGRMEQRESGDRMMKIFDEIMHHTRERTGMIVALCFDYSGEDELQRALRLWQANGAQGDIGVGYRDYLDLPRQGVPYRPTNLIIRTGKEEGESDRDGAFLSPYTIQGETRLRSSELLFPDFSPDTFEATVSAYLSEKKREGK